MIRLILSAVLLALIPSLASAQQWTKEDADYWKSDAEYYKNQAYEYCDQYCTPARNLCLDYADVTTRFETATNEGLQDSNPDVYWEIFNYVQTYIYYRDCGHSILEDAQISIAGGDDDHSLGLQSYGTQDWESACAYFGSAYSWYLEARDLYYYAGEHYGSSANDGFRADYWLMVAGY